jgi:ABC-type branched-subunit amino acid transport system ATPase component
MIRKVTLKNFKRFADVTFDVPGHLVLAGPNNTGKTTLLQAIAAWAFGYAKWEELNTDGNPRKNGHPWQDLERGQFSAVALRSFDLLWNNRQRKEPLEIGVQLDGLAAPIVMEFQFKAPGLARVRPRRDANVPFLKVAGAFTTTFVPAIAGLAREERRLADKESIYELLAQARAGEVLRNLLVQAHQQDEAWLALNAALARMFGIVLLPPTRGAELTCEYKQVVDLDRAGSPSFDVSTAGSGVLQVLLVLSLMLTQQGTVLLIDEPDAHLHLILQKTIYGELRSVAAKHNSQLIVATHSEQVIESVDPRELCLMYGKPRLVADTEEKAELMRSLGVLTHSDILHANGARGVLYTEDFTDLAILEAFARVLRDEGALKLLTVELVRKRAKAAAPDGLGELDPAKHWVMLKLVSEELPAVELLDGDSKNKADDFITGNAQKMQRLRWRYYEIESYLLHPAAVRMFLLETLGGDAIAADAGMAVLAKTLDERFIQRPNDLSELQLTYLRTEPVSKKLIPAVLQAAGLNNFPKSRFFEIAQHFEPNEVHAEVRFKLAQLKAAFGVGAMPPSYDQFAQTDV